jgi:hypothetical protein
VFQNEMWGAHGSYLDPQEQQGEQARASGDSVEELIMVVGSNVFGDEQHRHFQQSMNGTSIPWFNIAYKTFFGLSVAVKTSPFMKTGTPSPRVSTGSSFL